MKHLSFPTTLLSLYIYNTACVQDRWSKLTPILIHTLWSLRVLFSHAVFIIGPRKLLWWSKSEWKENHIASRPAEKSSLDLWALTDNLAEQEEHRYRSRRRVQEENMTENFSILFFSFSSSCLLFLSFFPTCRRKDRVSSVEWEKSSPTLILLFGTAKYWLSREQVCQRERRPWFGSHGSQSGGGISPSPDEAFALLSIPSPRWELSSPRNKNLIWSLEEHMDKLTPCWRGLEYRIEVRRERTRNSHVPPRQKANT